MDGRTDGWAVVGSRGRKSQMFPIVFNSTFEYGSESSLREFAATTKVELWWLLARVVFADRPRMISFLVEECGAPLVATDGSTTALHLAAQWGKTRAAVKLMELGAEINAKTSPCGDSPLHLAVQGRKKTKIVRLLLARGADVNARNNRGQTPVFEAVMDHSMAMTSILLRNGADACLKDEVSGSDFFPLFPSFPSLPFLSLPGRSNGAARCRRIPSLQEETCYVAETAGSPCGRATERPRRRRRNANRPRCRKSDIHA